MCFSSFIFIFLPLSLSFSLLLYALCYYFHIHIYFLFSLSLSLSRYNTPRVAPTYSSLQLYLPVSLLAIIFAFYVFYTLVFLRHSLLRFSLTRSPHARECVAGAIALVYHRNRTRRIHHLRTFFASIEGIHNIFWMNSSKKLVKSALYNVSMFL